MQHVATLSFLSCCLVVEWDFSRLSFFTCRVMSLLSLSSRRSSSCPGGGKREKGGVDTLCEMQLHNIHDL